MVNQQKELVSSVSIKIDGKNIALTYEIGDKSLKVNKESVRVISPDPENSNVQFKLMTVKYYHQSGVIPFDDIGKLTTQSVKLDEGHVKATFKSDRVIQNSVKDLF